MSLNKFTESKIEKKWMNINCNDLKCENLEISGDIVMTGAFDITMDNTSQCFIRSPATTFLSMLTINNTAPLTPGGFAACLSLGSTTTGSSLKMGQDMNVQKSIILSDSDLYISTFGAKDIVFSPNGSPKLTIPASGSPVTIAERYVATNQPYLEIKLPGVLSVPNNTTTPLSGMTTVTRNIGGITYVSGSGIFTVPNTGVYSISYSHNWDVGAPGAASFVSYILTGAAVYGEQGTNSDLSVVNSYSGSSAVYLTASSQFQVNLAQISGGALNITNAKVIVTQLS